MKKIEFCYVTFDYLFHNKSSVANFYKKHDMNGFESLYKEACVINEYKEQISKLSAIIKEKDNQLIVMEEREIGFLNTIQILTDVNKQNLERFARG